MKLCTFCIMVIQVNFIIINSKPYEPKNYCLELVITMLHYYKNNFLEATYLPYKEISSYF